VRADGLLTDPPGAARGDHVCWVYDTPGSFAEVARACLEEGLARGERLLWIAEADVGTVRAADGPLADLDRLRAEGTLTVFDVRAGYEGSGSFCPEEQLTFYDTSTRRAMADGYTGLRVVAELSRLAADGTRRHDLVRWEHLADEYISSGSGMVALCAYRRDLGPEALADVEAVHPLVRASGGGPPFRVWFDGPTILLAGALDTFGATRLAQVLADTPVAEPVVRIDVSRVHFVDVGGCRALARWARTLQEQGRHLELVGGSRVFRRVWRLVGFDDYVDVTFAEA